jgi:hypothetical protein
MADTEQQLEDSAAPPVEAADVQASATATEQQPAAADQLDSHIAEFEQAQPQPGGPTVDDFFAEPDASPEQVDEILRADASATVRLSEQIYLLRQGGAAAQQRAAQLEQTVLQMQYREFIRQDQADFRSFVKEAEEGIADLRYLPEGFAERFLLAEAIKDPQLREIWDHRNNTALDPTTRTRIASYLKGVQQKLYRAARSVPDPEATADREMVIQAMRGAGGKITADPPPNLGRMTDKQLNDFTADFGFRAV